MAASCAATDTATMAEVIRVFDEACSGHVERLFDELERQNPGSYAVKLRRRAQTTIRAERMHASIVGIIAANLLPLGFTGAMAAYQCPRRVDFHEFGRKRCALFVTIDDMDTSLRPLTSLFIRQAFSSLCDAADHGSPDGRLAVPVRLMLDDFANLNVANFDNILSVTRSREISCTIICQTISQLEARYGTPAANSIIGNCDAQLVLAFQDERTAQYFATRANKPASALLETPAGMWWVFVRGQRGRMEQAYRLEDHPRYPKLVACLERTETEAVFGTPDEWEFEEFFDFDAPDEPFSPCPAA